ncbi:hypothetical protein [Glutamicibacter ardleyensis]|uniref:Uncharacterized protein n=1 Tax=Glutamicibacter ardleyensis TaxID=225894 RepID=A0ABQ2DUY1_9MICC|nr:hypothetical protein [Glutamicibacter ardleyensis]GGJ74260.1 hypothetical protein GCM10007173_36520 [Glutamicibacter ardleyensis]
MGKYEAQGSGLSDPATRKKLYTAIIVLAALVLTTLVTMGIINLDQINGFVSLLVVVVGIVGSLVGLIAGALARANVDPPK